MKSIEILKVLDETAIKFTFPVLDNGYVYLASARLHIFCDFSDWCIVFEVFGYSPKARIPNIMTYTIGSKIKRNMSEKNFVTESSFDNYLNNNKFNEMDDFYPFDNEDWIDELEEKLKGEFCSIRGKTIKFPPVSDYEKYNIELEDSTPQIQDFCRYLSEININEIFCTNDEIRKHIPENMKEHLTLYDWQHPDIVSGELPSNTDFFKNLANSIEDRNFDSLTNIKKCNTHWKNWPEGGTL